MKFQSTTEMALFVVPFPFLSFFLSCQQLSPILWPSISVVPLQQKFVCRNFCLKILPSLLWWTDHRSNPTFWKFSTFLSILSSVWAKPIVMWQVWDSTGLQVKGYTSLPREGFALWWYFFNCLLAKPKNISLKGANVLPSCGRKYKPLLYGAKFFGYIPNPIGIAKISLMEVSLWFDL